MDEPRGRPRAPPRPLASIETREKNKKEKKVMTTREQYTPGPMTAEVEKNGESWALVLTKDLRHSPDKVWDALTDPAQLREWAPFDADRNMGAEGNTVKLTTVVAAQVPLTAH